MSNISVGIAADLLMPNVYERFKPLFGVASRKSLLTWTEVPSQFAEVLVVDQNTEQKVLQSDAPCVVVLGSSDYPELRNRPWVTRLKTNYTLADLIDVLDRAAVFMMDWKTRPTTSSAAPKVAVADPSYQLTSWIALAAPFNKPGCLKAMALMAREPVTLRQLCTTANLSVDAARELLVMLAERGVLKSLTQPTPVPRQATAPRVSGGLLTRLARWVMDGGKR